jgi:hypothetical protein
LTGVRPSEVGIKPGKRLPGDTPAGLTMQPMQLGAFRPASPVASGFQAPGFRIGACHPRPSLRPAAEAAEAGTWVGPGGGLWAMPSFGIAAQRTPELG